MKLETRKDYEKAAIAAYKLANECTVDALNAKAAGDASSWLHFTREAKYFTEDASEDAAIALCDEEWAA